MGENDGITEPIDLRNLRCLFFTYNHSADTPHSSLPPSGNEPTHQTG